MLTVKQLHNTWTNIHTSSCFNGYSPGCQLAIKGLEWVFYRSYSLPMPNHQCNKWSKLPPSHSGIWTPIQYMVLCAHPSQHPKRHHDAGLTDMSDRLCYSACSSMPQLASAAMQPKNHNCHFKTFKWHTLPKFPTPVTTKTFNNYRGTTMSHSHPSGVIWYIKIGWCQHLGDFLCLESVTAGSLSKSKPPFWGKTEPKPKPTFWQGS